MNTVQKQAMTEQFKSFFAAHKISSPHDRPVKTDNGITICSCGARWHTYYSDHGLEWLPLNDQCASHREEQAALPEEYGLDQAGNLFYDPPPLA